MTKLMTAAHKILKEPGGTVVVIAPILTVYIWKDHILLMPMASIGVRLEVSTIL